MYLFVIDGTEFAVTDKDSNFSMEKFIADTCGLGVLVNTRTSSLVKCAAVRR